MCVQHKESCCAVNMQQGVFLYPVFLALLIFSSFLLEVEGKSKAGKLVKNAAKAYTAHRAARSAMSIWRIAFFVFAVLIGLIGLGAVAVYLKRRFSSRGSEGFGLLREGP